MHNKNRKGSIGMTMTWVVGTIIVILVLILFLLAVSSLAKVKEIKDILPEMNGKERSYAEKKSCSAYQISEKKPCSDEFNIIKNRAGIS